MAGETNRAQQVPNPLDGIDQQEAVTTLVDTAPISGAANQPTRDTVDQAETLKYIGPVPKAADFGEPSVSLDQPQIVKPTTGPELKSPQQAFDGIEEVELDPTTEEELGFDPEAIDATKIIAEVGAKIGDQSGVLLDNNNKPFNGMSASEYVSWFITEHAESAGIWNKTDEELGIMAGDYETALTSSLGEIKDKVDVRLNTVGAEKQTAVTAIASGLVASIVREALRLKQTTREVPTPLDTSESIADTIPAIAPVVLETQQPEAMASTR